VSSTGLPAAINSRLLQTRGQEVPQRERRQGQSPPSRWRHPKSPPLQTPQGWATRRLSKTETDSGRAACEEARLGAVILSISIMGKHTHNTSSASFRSHTDTVDSYRGLSWLLDPHILRPFAVPAFD
jgi:hypothetical protein